MASFSVNITVLMDNQAEDGLLAEHGLALWITCDGKHILFDTGQSSALEVNAAILGVDLGKTDYIVLSHGHYDHSGGLANVLGRARHAQAYCHPAAVQPRYAIRNGNAKSIRMPHRAMAALDKLPSHRLHWVQGPLSLTEHVGLTGPILRDAHDEDVGGPFYLDPEGNRVDQIEDDLALWIKTEEGAIVCVGCSHAGIMNTLNQVRHLSDGVRIQAVIGGFHLLNASRKRLDDSISTIRRLNPDKVVPCHCTGDVAVAMLREALGDKVIPGKAGMIFTFGNERDKLE